MASARGAACRAVWAPVDATPAFPDWHGARQTPRPRARVTMLGRMIAGTDATSMRRRIARSLASPTVSWSLRADRSVALTRLRRELCTRAHHALGHRAPIGSAAGLTEIAASIETYKYAHKSLKNHALAPIPYFIRADSAYRYVKLYYRTYGVLHESFAHMRYIWLKKFGRTRASRTRRCENTAPTTMPSPTEAGEGSSGLVGDTCARHLDGVDDDRRHLCCPR